MKYLALCVLLALVVGLQALPTTPRSNGGIDFKNCSTPASQLSSVINITISPDPPKRGEEMIATVNVLLNEKVSGGDVTLKVTRIITVLTDTYKVCDIVVGKKCPLQPGVVTFKASQKIPSFAPGGTYDVSIESKDQDSKELNCIDFKIKI